MKKYMVQIRYGKVKKENGKIAIKCDEPTMDESFFEDENVITSEVIESALNDCIDYIRKI